MNRKTLGGDRLGSGNKMQVEMHGFERSTHDMSYIWRSTMAAGTLVPFLKEVALPGDTFDIELNCDIKTLPTIGPLFGSYKVQLDIFAVPMRLYHSALHNNMLGIGLNMAAIKLPKMELVAKPLDMDKIKDIDNAQVNPSSIFSYLGIRGVGAIPESEWEDTIAVKRKFNAIPYLAYWEIYKNYYSNKQEEIGYQIHHKLLPVFQTVDSIDYNSNNTSGTLPQDPAKDSIIFTRDANIRIFYTGGTPQLTDIVLQMTDGERMPVSELFFDFVDNGTSIFGRYNFSKYGSRVVYNWDYATVYDTYPTKIGLKSFPLDNIDTMRQRILASGPTVEFNVNTQALNPYQDALAAPVWEGKVTPYMQFNQEGLGIKTYQSDLFNNWLSTEWIDGAGGINEITAIDTSGGSFSIDTLNLSKKVYEMLNRIAVSGGTYDDWLSAVYDHESYTRAESPVYMGGLIKELVFQEVVSNAEGTSDNGTQPLGTLAGKGIMGNKHKGGKVVVRVDEPSYIMGIVSLTPRIDYSQGNKWDVNLETLDDLHKPSLDEIGFQELITEQMAWWSTRKIAGQDVWEQKSAGKQPAWINYMTNVNEVRGNFAIETKEMFMTLNRKYDWARVTGDNDGNFEIGDLTTYVDPEKFNSIFAQDSLDSQNFWTQISIDMTARRKMSAKVMPNL